MNKYLPGLLAFVLALGFTAFSTSDHFTEAVEKSTPEPALFWYNINPNGSLGASLNSGAQMEKSDALAFTPCQDITSTDCVRGYSSPQVVGTNPAPPTNSAPEYHIRKNQ